jgi:hypothetical protein
LRHACITILLVQQRFDATGRLGCIRQCGPSVAGGLNRFFVAQVIAVGLWPPGVCLPALLRKLYLS